LRKQEIRKVAVKQYPRIGIQNPQKRQASTQLVDNKRIWFQLT
jgi:hypothetical protein